MRADGMSQSTNTPSFVFILRSAQIPGHKRKSLPRVYLIENFNAQAPVPA